jgi:hypothetical protein
VTDLVLVAVLVFMAVLLGAASLAIVLLYRGWKSNRALITDLKAQVAAQQIAALTGTTAPLAAAGEDSPSEPVRRRRHLALYLGGGVVAVYTSCRNSLKRFIRTRPVLTTAAVATVATVSTAAALVLVPSGDSGDRDDPAPPTTSSDQPEHGPTPTPSPGASTSPDHTGPRGGEVWAEGPPHLSLVTPDRDETTAGNTPAPGSSSAPAEETGDESQQGGSGPSAVPPDQAPQAPDTGQPPATTPPPGGPEPSTPPPGAEDPEPPTGTTPDDDEEEDGGLCVKLPPLVDLCVLSGV